MGARKRLSAEKRKEANKNVAFAKLNRVQSSPRKMRLVADMVRGMEVEKALHILKNAPQHAANPLYKLLLSAIANWEAKNGEKKIEDVSLYIKEISVDSGRMLKRIQTAPQGRAHRIRKRSNHVTIVIDEKQSENK